MSTVEIAKQASSETPGQSRNQPDNPAFPAAVALLMPITVAAIYLLYAALHPGPDQYVTEAWGLWLICTFAAGLCAAQSGRIVNNTPFKLQEQFGGKTPD